MQKRKNFVFLCLIVLLLPAVVFGATDKKPQDLMTISVFIGRSFTQPAPDNDIYPLLEKAFNVRFEFEFLTGKIEEKLGVMVAGGDYPDVMTGHSKLVEAGALIPLEDLIEKNCPNLKSHYGPYWNRVKEPKDGHFYIMPNYGRIYKEDWAGAYYASAQWIQKSVLKEFGYPRPKTLDEYFDLIQKYVAKYPEIDGKPTLGYSVLSWDWRAFCLTNPPQFLAGNPNDGGVIVDKKTYVAKIFADKDVAKKYYKKLSDMNALGLVDKESFVQNYDQYLAKIASGRVIGMHDQYWQFQAAERSLIAQERYDRTYAPMPITYDKNTRDWYRDRPPLNLQNGYGITTNCKDPVRVLKLFDALLDEKWQKLLSWGIEGEDYLVGKDGRFYRTPEMRTAQTDPNWEHTHRANALYNDAPKIEGMFSDGNSWASGSQPEEYFANLKPYDKEILQAYKMNAFVEFLSPAPENPKYYPAWQIDLIDGSPAQIANKQLDELNKKYLPRAVLAAPADFDTVWQEYLNEMKKINVKAYEDRINDQIQWRLKNW